VADFAYGFLFSPTIEFFSAAIPKADDTLHAASHNAVIDELKNSLRVLQRRHRLLQQALLDMSLIGSLHKLLPAVGKREFMGDSTSTNENHDRLNSYFHRKLTSCVVKLRNGHAVETKSEITNISGRCFCQKFVFCAQSVWEELQ